MEIEVGNIIEHILTKDWFVVLEVENDNYTCRAKNYMVYTFRLSEIHKIR